MAKGYWGPSSISCRCCKSGPKSKFWCRTCDHVCKGPYGSVVYCPHCRLAMENMGQRWRPGKKGKRQDTPSQPERFVRPAGEKLRQKGRIRSWWV